MKKDWRIPAVESVCLAGFLALFFAVLLVLLPQIKQLLDYYGGRPPYLASVVLKVHDYLQPAWFTVLLGVAAAAVMFVVSQIWHWCMPEWPWVPVRLILAMGTALVLFVAWAIFPVLTTLCECL